jgi:hypothetical protein
VARSRLGRQPIPASFPKKITWSSTNSNQFRNKEVLSILYKRFLTGTFLDSCEKLHYIGQGYHSAWDLSVGNHPQTMYFILHEISDHFGQSRGYGTREGWFAGLRAIQLYILADGKQKCSKSARRSSYSLKDLLEA